MDYWLKTFGGGARRGRLRDDWKNEGGGILTRFATFPREPRRMRPGDGIVYYGAGWGVIFAAGKIEKPPFLDEQDDSPWRYRVRVSLTHALDFIHNGVPLDRLRSDRVLRQSIRQRGYIRLTREEYESALEQLELDSLVEQLEAGNVVPDA